MTLESPPTPLSSDFDRNADHHTPTQPQLERDNLPWTGLSLMLAIIGLLLFMAVPDRPLSPEQLEEQRVSAQVRIVYGRLRGAIEDYRSEHGRAPGNSPDGTIVSERNFRRQLMLSTDEVGHALPQSIESHPYGPYLGVEGVPENPFNGRSDVRLIEHGDIAREIDGESGWIYDPRMDELSLNAPGQWGEYRGEGLRL